MPQDHITTSYLILIDKSKSEPKQVCSWHWHRSIPLSLMQCWGRSSKYAARPHSFLLGIDLGGLGNNKIDLGGEESRLNREIRANLSTWWLDRCSRYSRGQRSAACWGLLGDAAGLLVEGAGLPPAGGGAPSTRGGEAARPRGQGRHR
jgi:hypothetical protein